MENGILENAAAFNAIGYRETIAFLQGKERSLLMDSINLAHPKIGSQTKESGFESIFWGISQLHAQSNGGGVDEFMWCRWS